MKQFHGNLVSLLCAKIKSYWYKMYIYIDFIDKKNQVDTFKKLL